ncbi:MAG: glycosyltransferase family 4 protein [Motiliproteus sp.]
MLNNWLYPVVVFFSVLLTYASLPLLRHQRLLDIPNERSSHTTPVPRAGGISFVLLYLLLLLWLWRSGVLIGLNTLVLCAGGLVVAATGLIDDRYGLSSKFRLLVQFLCFGVSVPLLSYPFLNFDTAWLLSGSIIFVTIMLSVWWLNLFNFLDGIDGYAVSEAVFLCLSAAGLCWLFDAVSSSSALLLLAASLVGFIVINWPPAKLFMGDVGSYFLGFMLSMLALLTMLQQIISPLSWIILTALFWVDASYTLLLRMFAGESWHQAHRSHAYQVLSRGWNSHSRVTVTAITVNTCWLFPMAYGGQWLIESNRIVLAWIVMIMAVLPILWGVIRIKATIKID